MGSRNRRPLSIAAVVAVALAVCAAGGATAWYSTRSGISNAFATAHVSPEIVEAFDVTSGVKSDVRVTVPDDGSNVAAYVRARVDLSWRDGDGAQLWDLPAGSDYDLVMGADVADAPGVSKWVRGDDGFYYWCSPVEPGASTSNLIDELRQTSAAADRTLVADVSVQAVQSDPAAAFNESWSTSSGLSVGAGGVLERRP